MIIYGGQYQNGGLSSDILNFDLEYNDWSRLIMKSHYEPLVQMKACSV